MPPEFWVQRVKKCHILGKFSPKAELYINYQSHWWRGEVVKKGKKYQLSCLTFTCAIKAPLNNISKHDADVPNGPKTQIKPFFVSLY